MPLLVTVKLAVPEPLAIAMLGEMVEPDGSDGVLVIVTCALATATLAVSRTLTVMLTGTPLIAAIAVGVTLESVGLMVVNWIAADGVIVMPLATAVKFAVPGFRLLTLKVAIPLISVVAELGEIVSPGPRSLLSVTVAPLKGALLESRTVTVTVRV
jgi:type IV secretory pathway TrbD component